MNTLPNMPIELEKLAAQRLPPLPFQNVGCVADIPGEAARADAVKQWTLNAQRRGQREDILRARQALRARKANERAEAAAEKREAAKKEREEKKAARIAAAVLNRTAKRTGR